MDQWMRNLLYKHFSVGKFKITVLELMLAVCISGVGVFLRMAVLEPGVLTAQRLTMLVLDYCMAFMAAGFVRGRGGGRGRVLLTYGLFVIWPVFAANSTILGGNGAFLGLLLILGLLLWDRGQRLLCGLCVLGSGVLAALTLGPRGPEAPLTLGWPNIYELVGKQMFQDRFDKISLLFLGGILLCIGYCMYERKLRLTKDTVLPALAFLALLLPYFAAFMPAWAGYPADVLLLLWAILVPRRFYAAFLHAIVSYSAYANWLNRESKLPMVWYSVVLFVLLLDTGACVYRGLCGQKKDN